jgi:dCTP deaminase
MLLKADEISHLLQESQVEGSKEAEDPLFITPMANAVELQRDGAGSIDLRLGTWFETLRQARMGHLSVKNESEQHAQLAKSVYVPFGGSYYLHPGSFVLSITLEWLRIPSCLAAYVIGKSSWGRRGLIIATATGVHPGFTGSLTLELSNVGELPVEILPGMPICQLFFHRSPNASKLVNPSQFAARRKPTIGNIALDPIARKLAGLPPSTPANP